MSHLTTAQLEAGESKIHQAPGDKGTVEMLVSRPSVDAREVLNEGQLLIGQGLAGDNYVERGNSRTAGGQADPEAQLNLMNASAIDLVANGVRDRWAVAGDQMFVDFDLSLTNAPAGTRLSIGTAVIEVSAKPHTGCAKFAERFGIDAARWVNSSPEHRYRGINAMVVQDGMVKAGDKISKVS